MTNQSFAQQYWDNGYQFPVSVMTAEEAGELRTRLESFEKNVPIHLPYPLQRYLRANAHIVMKLAADVCCHPNILDAVEQILGENILCWSCEFFIKEAHTDKIVSWHQDLKYWGLGSTEDEVTAWLALSPSTVESGCVRFVAGSHKNELLPHEDGFAEDNLLSRGQEIAVDVDENSATNVILQPGEMSLHHGRIFHASGPNQSADRRIGLAIRYVTPKVRQQIAQRDYAMLVRGIDEYNNWIHYTASKEDFDASSLALHEKIFSEQSLAFAQDSQKKLSFS